MKDLLIMVIDTNTGETVCTFDGDAEIYDATETVELLEHTLTLVKQIELDKERNAIEGETNDSK